MTRVQERRACVFKEAFRAPGPIKPVYGGRRDEAQDETCRLPGGVFVYLTSGERRFLPDVTAIEVVGDTLILVTNEGTTDLRLGEVYFCTLKPGCPCPD
jgi:hypothetical protein